MNINLHENAAVKQTLSPLIFSVVNISLVILQPDLILSCQIFFYKRFHLFTYDVFDTLPTDCADRSMYLFIYLFASWLQTRQ